MARKMTSNNYFAMEEARKLMALEETRPAAKILKRKTKVQFRGSRDESEGVLKSEAKKKRKMESRIFLSCYSSEWSNHHDHVLKICPNAVKVLPPVPPHIKKDSGRRRVTFKLEETSSC